MAMVCPWYVGYFLINPLRYLVQRPSKILAPLVQPGAAAFEPGAGMGYFTLELARQVGPVGRVYVADIQPRMLHTLERRAARAGVLSRIETRLANAGSLCVDDLEGRIDFVLSFAVVHEMPDIPHFFEQTGRCLKRGGRMLLAEPRGHVTAEVFAEELAAARKFGLRTVQDVVIWASHAAVLEKE